MTGAYAAAAKKLCLAFYEALSDAPAPAALHARFQRAVSFTTPYGLFTLLAGEELSPYSATVEGLPPLPPSLPENAPFTVCRSGLACGSFPLVSFAEAKLTDLRAMQSMESAAACAFNAAAVSIGDFLAKDSMEAGLSVLASEDALPPPAAFFKPRLDAFRAAAREGDVSAIAQAAARCAGLGPGLTPSSDDLLLGYFAVEAAAFSSAWVAPAARAAAGCTSSLSAQLLLGAQRALVGEFTLALFSSVAREGADLEPLLLRIANHGASSGRDYLTGLYFGFLDAAQKRRKEGRNRLALSANP